MAAALPVLTPLAAHSGRVRTGTPLRPGPSGWEIAPGGEGVEAWAAGGGHGPGESFKSWRQVTLQTYLKQFVPGARYKIADIQETGHVVFVPDENGPLIAFSQSEIFCDASKGKS